MNELTKSIDDILLSIESNRQIIDEMLNTAKENNAAISGRMEYYAGSHICLNREQMSAYADYAKAYDNVKKLYTIAADTKGIEQISELHNTSLALSLLDEMHSKQLTLMQLICSVLEKASTAIKMLCTERQL